MWTRPHDRRPLRLALCAMMLLLGARAVAQPDGGKPDGAMPDGAMPDGAMPDGDGSDAGATALAPEEPALPAEEAEGCILRAELEGVVSGGTAEYLPSAVEEAERARCQMLLLVIDTPGGMLDATRAIVRSLLAAEVPIVTFVAPAGARAGSAGVFITMAGHVAAMVPGSNIGAAHPVVGMGKDPEQAGGEHMAQKIENDTAAFARSIAEQRGRNAEWAEKAVRESVSATASEALEKNVVDLLAKSEDALLAELEGRVVEVGGRALRLHPKGAERRSFEMTIRQKAMAILGDPTLAYVLFMIGALGLMMELYNPGLIVPGAVGAFCLILAAVGMQALPVNLGAAILIAVGIALFVAELHVASFGLLTLGGVLALVAGSALLIDESDPTFFAEPSVRLSWGAIAPLVTLLSIAAIAFAWQAMRVRKRRVTTGREALVGMRGRTLTTVGPSGGRVSVQGESWKASSEAALREGTPVRVTEVQGLELRVEPEESAD